MTSTFFVGFHCANAGEEISALMKAAMMKQAAAERMSSIVLDPLQLNKRRHRR
jgi:hypothetical protein